MSRFDHPELRISNQVLLALVWYDSENLPTIRFFVFWEINLPDI